MSNTPVHYDMLPKGYEPSENEQYMSPNQLAYFKNILSKWKEDLLRDPSNAIENLSGLNQPDLNDQAAMEAEAAIELRHKDRKRKLVSKINEALEKIKTGEYGYCEETGEAIGVSRLKARPIATLCIDAQERYERHKKQFTRDEEEADSGADD